MCRHTGGGEGNTLLKHSQKSNPTLQKSNPKYTRIHSTAIRNPKQEASIQPGPYLEKIVDYSNHLLHSEISGHDKVCFLVKLILKRKKKKHLYKQDIYRSMQ